MYFFKSFIVYNILYLTGYVFRDVNGWLSSVRSDWPPSPSEFPLNLTHAEYQTLVKAKAEIIMKNVPTMVRKTFLWSTSDKSKGKELVHIHVNVDVNKRIHIGNIDKSKHIDIYVSLLTHDNKLCAKKLVFNINDDFGGAERNSVAEWVNWCSSLKTCPIYINWQHQCDTTNPVTPAIDNDGEDKKDVDTPSSSSVKEMKDDPNLYYYIGAGVIALILLALIIILLINRRNYKKTLITKPTLDEQTSEAKVSGAEDILYSQQPLYADLDLASLPQSNRTPVKDDATYAQITAANTVLYAQLDLQEDGRYPKVEETAYAEIKRYG